MMTATAKLKRKRPLCAGPAYNVGLETLILPWPPVAAPELRLSMYPRPTIAPMIRENCCQAPTRTAGESEDSNVRNVVEDGTVRFLLLKYRFLIAESPFKFVQSVEVSSAAQDFICFNAWLWRITHPRAFSHRDGSLRQPVGDRLAKDARDSPITALVARNKMA